MNKLSKIKLKFANLIWLLFYILTLFLLLNQSFKYLDPDFGWHLKTGEEIIKSQDVPRTNTVNFMLIGEPWIDHEWLLDAGLYWSYQNFGYLGVSIIFALLITLIFWIFNFFLKKELNLQNNSIWVLLPLELFGLMAIIPSTGIRLQEFNLLFLLFLLLIIYYYNKNKNWRLLIWLPILFYLWTNSHGGFLLGLAVIFFFIGVKIFEKLINRFKLYFIDNSEQLTSRQITIFGIFSLLAFGVTFLTPYRLELYSFLSSYTNTFYMNNIAEWLPQWTYPYQYTQLVFIALVMVAIIIHLVYTFTKKEGYKIKLWEFGLLLVFTYLAISARRHTPLLFMVALPFLVNFFTKNLTIEIKFFSTGPRWLIVGGKIFIILVFTLLITSKIVSTNFVREPFNYFCENLNPQSSDGPLYPCQAVSWLKNHPKYQDYKMFNNYGWGGYLIWAYPEKQIFIDGRQPQTSYKNHSLLEEYLEFFKEGQAQAKLDEYNIRLVLFKKPETPVKINWFEKYFLMLKEEKFAEQKNLFLEYLANSPEWTEVYSDNLSYIYVKK